MKIPLSLSVVRLLVSSVWIPTLASPLVCLVLFLVVVFLPPTIQLDRRKGE